MNRGPHESQFIRPTRPKNGTLGISEIHDKNGRRRGVVVAPLLLQID
jgi:hypothetical protein